MAKALETNTFFDINKLPPKKGLLLMGLSMNKLLNRQKAENCLEDIRNFTPSKVSKPLIGCNFIYSDFLYLYSDQPASELKHSFMNQVINHRNSVKRLIEKNFMELQIQHAFNYMVWNQLYVGTNDFNNLFEKVKRLYEQDEKWQAYIAEDCRTFGREADDNQVNYFLEESLMVYLLNKNQIKLPNEYIENNQEWILFCYPGRPIRSMIYIHQLNPFKLDWPSSPYQNSFYDLEAKQLVDCLRVDLGIYKVQGRISGPVPLKFFLTRGKTIKGTSGAEIDRRIKIKSQNIFSKEYSDAFWNPGLSDLLIKNHVNQIYVAGIAADECVRATAFGAVNRGYKVKAVKEAIGMIEPFKLQNTLEGYVKKGIDVVSVSQIRQSAHSRG